MGPYKFDEQFLKKTIEIWQTRCPQPLTLQDAEEIVGNAVELVKLLSELDQKYGKPIEQIPTETLTK